MDVGVDDTARANGGRKRPVVIKFGGTSVTGGDRIDTIAEVITDRFRTSRPVIVVSAFARVTTLLEAATLAARSGAHEGVFMQLRTIHEDAVKSMTDASPHLCATVDTLLTECGRRLDGIASEGECSTERLDEILAFGERLSSAIITRGLLARGIAAHAVDAAGVVVTDANFGDARADLEATRRHLGALLPPVSEVAAAPAVAIVTGFIGATPEGVRTTLGREGSDYSAAVLAWGLFAEAVEIWTDVDGIMTADPRVVPEARPLRDLTYEELLELTSWGAKVVHPKTVRPLRDRGIVLTIRNTLSPDDPGTQVGPDGRRRERRGPLGVTCIDSVTFLAMATHVGATEFEEEQRAALATLREFDGPCSVVTVVGEGAVPGASGTPHHLLDVFASEGVTVHAVAEGASGRSISYVVHPDDGDVAVRVAHRALFDGGDAPVAERTTTHDRREVEGVHA